MSFALSDLPDYYTKGYPSLKVGICQVYTEEWEVEANLSRTLDAIDSASEQGAEIAVTPECVVQGYPVYETDDRVESYREKLFSSAISAEGEQLRLFRKKAKDKGLYILIGFIETGAAGSIHNSAALISPDGHFIYIYRKVHCRHFESIDHRGFFTPGSDFHSAGLKFGDRQFNVGTMICFDREIPESLRCLRSLGAEVVLCPLATDTSEITASENSVDNETITRVGSASNELFTVVVNHAGRFNGGSFITGPAGEVVCQMDAEPGVVTYELPAGVVSAEFHNQPLGWMGWGYRRPDIYKKYI